MSMSIESIFYVHKTLGKSEFHPDYQVEGYLKIRCKKSSNATILSESDFGVKNVDYVGL